MGLKSLLENQDGGKSFSAAMGLIIIVALGFFFALKTHKDFAAGDDLWWMNLGALASMVFAAFRLIKFLRSRHAG